jgi:hypothetical protein
MRRRRSNTWPSWPGLTRPSSSLDFNTTSRAKPTRIRMDGRVKPGHDDLKGGKLKRLAEDDLVFTRRVEVADTRLFLIAALAVE